jgi:hypothetical protein
VGLYPKAGQTRLIAVWFEPVAAGIEPVDQLVALGKLSFRVFTITRSTSIGDLAPLAGPHHAGRK